jgi:hypothetical protein
MFEYFRARNEMFEVCDINQNAGAYDCIRGAVDRHMAAAPFK